jgi:hypothetical protein
VTTKTYDAKSVSVIVNGVFLTGFSESVVEIEKDEDNFEAKVGAQGDVVRAKVNNPLGTVKVTLLQDSPQLAMLDRLANTGALVPLSVMYAGDPKETTTATEAYLKKPAARKYAKSAEDREYEFQCLDLKME